MFSYNLGVGFMVILTTLVLFVLTILLGAGLATFQITSWTLLFSKLEEGKASSKILRWVSKYSSARKKVAKQPDSHLTNWV